MDNSIPIKPEVGPRATRGIWQAQPRAYQALQSSTIDNGAQDLQFDLGILSPVEPEIRSKASIRKNGPTSPGSAHEIVGEAVFKAFDTEPLWSNHMLTKRRPNLEEISWTLADVFDWMNEYLIVPYEDLVVVIRLRAVRDLETCAIVTVEPAYVDGEVCYWLRCSIYEGSESTSLHVGFLRAMASFYEVLDYPDANLIDSLKYSLASKASIAAYANHPDRAETLFLVPKRTTDTRARKHLRFMASAALLPYGVVGELGPDVIRDVTGIDPPKDVCAIALPPQGHGSLGPRIVLAAPTTKSDTGLMWAGMSEYLNEIGIPDAPWLSDSYQMHPAQDAAAQYARLMPHGSSYVIRPYWLDKRLAEHIRATTEQPGWDLYSPLPVKVNVEHPATDEVRNAGEPESETISEPEPDTFISVDRLVAVSEDTPDLGYPSSLSDLPTWVQSRLSSALEIAPRAIREMKKFRHPQPERIAQALELLAGPRLATFRNDRSAAREFHQGLAKLRMRDGFSGAERLVGRTGSDYLLNHEGKTFLLDRHLASNSSGFNDPKMIRIYYFYDPESEKIIVGWLPTHLQTSKS